MIIFHHLDHDGNCAAAIVYNCCRLGLPIPKQWATHFCGQERIVFEGLDFNKPIPIEKIQPAETVAIVDYSFKPEIIQQIRKITQKIIWCDHHITAKDYDYGEPLEGLRDFVDKGLSGCEVTWKYLYPSTPFPRAVETIGDYDSWRLKIAPTCFELYEGLKMENTKPDSEIWLSLLDPTQERPRLFDQIVNNGKLIIKYRDSYCEGIASQFGYETIISGEKAFAMNVYRFGSKQFGKRFDEYPLCIAYIFDGHKYTVSLYSEKVDVSIIAKSLGGGGHKGAAGFTCEKLPFEPILF